MVSGGQQRDSAIHIHVSILPQTPVPAKLPQTIDKGSLCYKLGPWLNLHFWFHKYYTLKKIMSAIKQDRDNNRNFLIFILLLLLWKASKTLHVLAQSFYHVQLFEIPGTAACQDSLSFTLFAQTHVHWVNDAIQPSHPLSPPSPLALILSQHQKFFQWVSSSHQVAKLLEF